MSTSKSTAASPADNSKVTDEKVVIPTQVISGDNDSGCDQTDEKVSALSKVKVFVVTNKKAILGSVALLASVAVLKLAKAQKAAQAAVQIEDENGDPDETTESV